jgi:hypothetical protein
VKPDGLLRQVDPGQERRRAPALGSRQRDPEPSHVALEAGATDRPLPDEIDDLLDAALGAAVGARLARVADRGSQEAQVAPAKGLVVA